MPKFNIEQTLKEIKRWLEPEYHHLLDKDIYNISFFHKEYPKKKDKYLYI